MKCGNCKQSHKTARDVRECYGQPDEVPTSQYRTDLRVDTPRTPFITAVPEKVTKRQLDYLKVLAEERPAFCDVNNLHPDIIEKLTKPEATQWIGMLLDNPKERAALEKTGGQLGVIRPQCPIPTKGRFTVVLYGKRHTLRFASPATGNFAGRTVVSFLSGPNNDDDYTGFAHVDNGKVIVWKHYRNSSFLLDCLNFLLAGKDNQAKAGGAYAVESGNCFVCGRTLTVPESIAAGIGPVCAEGGW